MNCVLFECLIDFTEHHSLQVHPFSCTDYSLSFLVAEQCPIVCKHIFFIRSSLDGHSPLQDATLRSYAVTNMVCKRHWNVMPAALLGGYLEGE